MFSSTKSPNTSREIDVIEFEITKDKQLKIIKSIDGVGVSKEVWGLCTGKFHKVNIACLSPNYWDEKTVGNKHLFFIMDKCKNPDEARGMFNEYLRQDLNEHRKVFEMLGAKTRVEHTDEQLSGIGFSETQKDEFTVRVGGKFTRILKVVVG